MREEGRDRRGHDHATMDDAARRASAPGRQASTDGLRWPAAPADQVRAWLGIARGDIGALNAAIGRADFGSALLAGRNLGHVLAAMQRMLAHPALDEAVRRELGVEVAQVIADAEPVRARAPAPDTQPDELALAERRWLATIGPTVGAGQATASLAAPHMTVAQPAPPLEPQRDDDAQRDGGALRVPPLTGGHAATGGAGAARHGGDRGRPSVVDLLAGNIDQAPSNGEAAGHR
jgi:hypothetical protein